MNRGPVIDGDVHHTWRSDAEVLSYMPKAWRQLVDGSGAALRPVTANFIHPGRADLRMDSFPPNGGPPGSDYPTMREQLLDEHGITRAILGFDVGHEVAQMNPDYATELARAANRWNADHWLAIDDPRIVSKVMVANHKPHEAASIIREFGGHPKVVEVLMVTNGLGHPFGHPIYDPIYEAAVEMGLPLGIHVAPGFLHKGVQYVGGMPTTRMEYLVRFPETHVNHLTSFIVNGTFEKFPQLKVLFIECGVAWLAWALESLDLNFARLRQESPWVRRLPSEYFYDHIKVTTQPLDSSPRVDGLTKLLERLPRVSETICFSTDYPHWDFDNPYYVEKRLPEEWRELVFYRNAASVYGWEPEALSAEHDERFAHA